MPIEKRTRAESFLPLRSDLNAYQVSLEWLAGELAFIRGGATLTTPFSGLFVSSTRIDVVQDAIRILFCDCDANPDNQDETLRLVSYLENVKGIFNRSIGRG